MSHNNQHSHNPFKKVADETRELVETVANAAEGMAFSPTYAARKSMPDKDAEHPHIPKENVKRVQENENSSLNKHKYD